MRILIEGIGLSGCQSLGDGLVQQLARRGRMVDAGSDGKAVGWLNRLSGYVLRNFHPESVLLAWTLVLSYSVELFRPRPLGGGVIHIQVGYVDQAIALCETFGHRLPAALLRVMARWLPRFDKEVYLTASHLERMRRYLRKPVNNPMGRLVLTEPDHMLELDQRLSERMSARGVEVLATDGLDTDDVLDAVMAGLELPPLAATHAGPVRVAQPTTELLIPALR